MSSVFFVFEYCSVYLYLSNDAKGIKDKESLFLHIKEAFIFVLFIVFLLCTT